MIDKCAHTHSLYVTLLLLSSFEWNVLHRILHYDATAIVRKYI